MNVVEEAIAEVYGPPVIVTKELPQPAPEQLMGEVWRIVTGGQPLGEEKWRLLSDACWVMMDKMPKCESPLIHRFTPGLYSRHITMPKGAMILSGIHQTEHQFVVAKGRTVVATAQGVETYEAPYVGITKPGTQRILFIEEECEWITFHPTDKTIPEEIIASITECRALEDARKTIDDFRQRMLTGGT
jgi:hypothetical protein